MPNNPYSPEAIQKRLLAKSTSSLFDMITSKQDFDEANETSQQKEKSDDNAPKNKLEEIKPNKLSASVSTENIGSNRRTKSPSPKILKEVLADEVPQYKRYIELCCC